MACTTARLAALLLLCLALGDGGFGRQSAGQQAAAAAAPPGLPCTALVDTDTPDEWTAVGDVPSARLAAHALLLRHYSNAGGPATCGPLASSPDTDILILGACSRDSLTALLFYARFVCGKKTCAGKPCTYGVKLLGTAKTLPATDPRVTQLDVVTAEPSAPAQGTGVVQRAGGSYIRAKFAQIPLAALPYKDLLDSSTGGPLKLHLKSGEVWRAVTANPASFGSGYPRMPPPSKASAASSGGPQVAALPTCVEITGLTGFEQLARAAPPSLFAASTQAAFLAYYSTVNKTAAKTCPLSQTGGKVKLGAVLVDAMRVCHKATTGGAAYGLRFTAYFPCITGQGRFAVIDSTSVQPGPTHEPAYGPTEVLSLPPNSTAGIGRGADVGISTRTRLFGKFTRVSSIQATDIAVDPTDPANIWIVGAVDEFKVSPACNRPYGGPLLKWNWATSSFWPVASMAAVGMRVTIMPGVKKPWVVDSCGQLIGWGQGGKRLYGPAPQGQLYDIAAANGTVFSGCSSYTPSTFEGDIAAGCSLSAAVGPGRALYTSDSGDVAVTADGIELLANGQGVIYKDAALERYFRAYKAPDGYCPMRIAAGSNGSIWLVVAPPENALLTTRTARLAGVYRGFIHRDRQTKPPSWPKACAEVDPACADGGCDAGLTRCLRCAPQYFMGTNGKCRPLVCTDIDPNCAKCGEGAMCITCRTGFVRGFHSGDSLCRRPITGSIKCWHSANGSAVLLDVTTTTRTWRHVTSSGYNRMTFLDNGGNIWNVAGGGSLTSYSTGGTFRTVSSYSTFSWYGLTATGALANFDSSTVGPVPLPNRPDLAQARFVAAVAIPYGVCGITTTGQGICTTPPALSIPHVHSVCSFNYEWACFLSVYGDVRCWGVLYLPPVIVPPPLDGERWVEIVCSHSSVCARASTGAVRCFHPRQSVLDGTLLLPGRYSMLAAFTSDGQQRLCGVTTDRKVRCAWKAGISKEANLAGFEPAKSWAAVNMAQEYVCAISSQ